MGTERRGGADQGVDGWEKVVKTGTRWLERGRVFRGVNEIALDGKGRLAVPTRYRDEILALCSGSLVFTIDRESCLLLYPLPVWERLEAALVRLPNLDPHARRLQRLLLGHATEVTMDGHGRLLVPAPLRDFARLDHDAVLVGQGEKFELWDATLWRDNRERWIAEQGRFEGDAAGPLGTLRI
jgi:MraZ protein